MKKKVYEKPRVYLERFELSQHIANCYFEPNNADGCGYIGDKEWGLDYYIVITSDISGCLDTNPDLYCETNGGDFKALLNS